MYVKKKNSNPKREMDKYMSFFDRKTFSNPTFLRRLKDSLGKNSNIDEMLELLNSYKIGNETDWIAKIDNILGGLHDLPEFVEYVIEIEDMREFIRTNLCMFLIAPKILCIIRAMFTYLLEVLKYANLTTLSELSQLEQTEMETGNRSFLLDVYSRIFRTVYWASVSIVMENSDIMLPSIIPSDQVVKPPKWKDERNTRNDRGKLLLDKQAWIEFNEYLQNCGDVYNNPASGGCATM